MKLHVLRDTPPDFHHRVHTEELFHSTWDQIGVVSQRLLRFRVTRQVAPGKAKRRGDRIKPADEQQEVHPHDFLISEWPVIYCEFQNR